MSFILLCIYNIRILTHTINIYDVLLSREIKHKPNRPLLQVSYNMNFGKVRINKEKEGSKKDKSE